MSDGFNTPEQGPEVFDETACALDLATRTAEIFTYLNLDIQASSVADIEGDETGRTTGTFTVQQTLDTGVCVILSITDYMALDLDPEEEPTVDVQTMVSLQFVKTTDSPGLGKITEITDFHVNLTDAQEAIEYPDRCIDVDIPFQRSLIDEDGAIRNTRSEITKHDIDEAIMRLGKTRPSKWRRPAEPISSDQQVKIRLSGSTQDYLDNIGAGAQSSADPDPDYEYWTYPVPDESIKNTRWLLAGLAGSIAVAFSSGTPEPVQTILQEGGLMAIVPTALHFYLKGIRNAHTK